VRKSLFRCWRSIIFCRVNSQNESETISTRSWSVAKILLWSFKMNSRDFAKKAPRKTWRILHSISFLKTYYQYKRYDTNNIMKKLKIIKIKACLKFKAIKVFHHSLFIKFLSFLYFCETSKNVGISKFRCKLRFHTIFYKINYKSLLLLKGAQFYALNESCL
jgi:predicted transposase YbfD/YdcC